MQLGEQRRDRLRLGGVARDGDLVAAHADVGVELLLDEPQQVVALAEQVDHGHVRRPPTSLIWVGFNVVGPRFRR